MTKNTICKYPFTSIAVKEYDSNGKPLSFWPCCMMGNQTLEEIKSGTHVRLKFPLSPGENISNYSPLDFFNHPGMQQLRENLKNGIRDKACTVCWEMEDRNITSFRNLSFHRNEEIRVPDNIKLETIDMSINNKCNLRCRMCAPSASSLLTIDHKYFVDNNLLDDLKKSAVRWGGAELGAFKLKTNKQWQWIINNTDKFNVLRLSGGEPFYNEDVLEFLDTAIANGNAKNITLEFHTNGTLLDDELIDKLSHFNNNLNFSVDGTGKVYDFIRYPATWNELDSRLNNFAKRIPQKFLNLAFIVMVTNIFNIPEYVKWANSFNNIVRPVSNPGVSVSYAEVHSQDRGISIRSMPIYLLEEAKKEVEEAGKQYPLIDVSNAINIINDAITNNTENKNKAKSELELFDRARNQDFRDYLDARIVKWLDSV